MALISQRGLHLKIIKKRFLIDSHPERCLMDWMEVVRREERRWNLSSIKGSKDSIWVWSGNRRPLACLLSRLIVSFFYIDPCRVSADRAQIESSRKRDRHIKDLSLFFHYKCGGAAGGGALSITMRVICLMDWTQ